MKYPGVDSRQFKIVLKDNQINEQDFIFGIDWNIEDEPVECDDGYKYTIKCLSNRMLNFIKNDLNR